MFQNYLKIAFRNVLKRKGFAAINIFGLAIATAVSLLLFATSIREFSFDNFHANSDSIYNLYFKNNRPGGAEYATVMPMPLAPTLENEVPTVEAVTRIQGGQGGDFLYNEKVFSSGMTLVDEAFLDMFTFPIIKGNPENPLAGKQNIVLSERTAERIFGAEDPIGKTLRLQTGGETTQEYTVSAVAAKMPYHSTIKFNILGRIENSTEFSSDQWDNYNHDVYVQLADGVKVQQVQEQLQAFTEKHFAEDIELMVQSGSVPDENGHIKSLHLLPLNEVHFATGITSSAINKMYPIGLLLIGAFILAIACINFINLTLGTSVSRSLEVGVRKVMGASKRQLIAQFWGEALLIIGISLLVSLAFVQWILPKYSALFRYDISIFDPFVLTALGSILILVGLIAGGYPAFVLSRFQAAQVLKKETHMQRPGMLRNLLVVLQFSISILLLCSTVIVMQQISLLQNKPLGFNKAEVISIPIGYEIEGRRAIELMRNKLASYPDALSVTGTYRNLGMGKDRSSSTSIMGFEQDGQEVRTHWIPIDFDYAKTLELKLVDGRPLDRQRDGRDTIVPALINEAFAKTLGTESVVGTILATDRPTRVVGVVEDFHFNSLHDAIEPLTLALDKDFPLQYIFVRANPQNLPKTMAYLEDAWAEIAPKTPFQASFLDENTQRQYEQEQTLSRIFIGAAILTIMLSCMGLFAIAVLSIVQRTKEIGIRKVLGASVPSIVGMLSKDFIRLVFIASIIAIPLAWYAMDLWLQDFYYRIDIQPWVFVGTSLVALLIAFLTVSVHSVRAALANPVNSLRSE